MTSPEKAIASSSQVHSLVPPLKWAGGKRWLVDRLTPYWDEIQPQRLVEPFCGGLAIALGVSPQQALLNDINPHLINFYHQIQQGLSCNIRMENQADCYYQNRTEFNHLIECQQAQNC